MPKLAAAFTVTLLLTHPVWSQQPTKEYIYLGDRVIAIEESAGNQGVSNVVPAEKVYPPTGAYGTLTGSFVVIAVGNWSVVGVPSWITITSASSGTGTGTVYYSVSPQSGGSSPRIATIQVGTRTVSIKQLGAGAVGPPNSVSVSPDNGTGDVATLEFRAHSPAGGGYIEWIQGIINYGPDGRDACHFIYTARDGAVLLSDGLNVGWVGSGYMGQSIKLTNAQCEIDLAASTQEVIDRVVINGQEIVRNEMIVRLAIRFQPIFAGTYTISMLTGDSGGGWESAGAWLPKGNWTPFPAPPPPSVISSSPDSGVGPRKTFSYQINSANGPSFIRQGLILLSPALDGNSGCYLGFHRSTGMFYLNGQTGFAGASGAAGQAGTIESLRCRLHLATSAMLVSANSLNVTVDVEFLPTMAGTVTNWIYPVDRPNQTPGWLNRGSWTIGAAGPGGLVSHWRAEGNAQDSIGSNHGTAQNNVTYGSGASQQGFVFGAPPANPPYAQVSIGSGATMTSQRTISAWVKFNAFTSKPLPIVTVGGPDSAADWLAISGVGTQCAGQYRLSFDHWGTATLCGTTVLVPDVWYHVAHTYDGSTSRIYVNGTVDAAGPVPTYTPLLGTMDIGRNETNGPGAVLISPQFHGIIDEVRYHNVALSTAEVNAIYNSIPPPPGPILPISVASTLPAANGSTIFTFTFSGGSLTKGGAVLIGQSSGDGSQSCFMLLDRTPSGGFPGTITLFNDLANGATSGPIGGAGTITNSICEINHAGASVTQSGSNWVFTIPARFMPLFRGQQKIFMVGHDAMGSPVGSFSQLGTITPFGAPAPATATVAPNSGAGPSRKFTYTFNVGADGKFIRYGFALLNSILDGSNGCAVSFDTLQNTFYMNPFVAPTTQGVGGTSGILAGPRCSLNLSTSTITATTTTLVVELDLTFASNFVGTKNNYVQVVDRSNATAGWNIIGTWTPGPETLRLSPAEHFGVMPNQPRTFAVDCGSANQATGLQWSVLPAGFASVTPSGDGRTATVLPSGTPPSAVLTVQVTGSCGGSAPLTAQGQIYMYYYQNPVGPFVSPAAGSGSVREFLFHWSIQPGNGGIADTAPVQLLIAPSSTTADSSCYLMFFQNTVSLRSDTSNTWVPVQPGGGYPPLPSQQNATSNHFVENSQCRLSWTKSYTTTDTVNRYVNMNLLFKPTFAGAKGVFGRRENADAATAFGFSQIGSWVVPQ